MNCVCVLSGVCDSAFEAAAVADSSAPTDVDAAAPGLFTIDVLPAGNAWIPKSCARFECVKKAKGEVLKSDSPPLFGDAEDLDSLL